MFKEYERSSFTDLQNRTIYRFRVGDRIIYNDKRGIIIEKRSLAMVLNGQSDTEAKSLLNRLKTEFQDVNEFYISVIQIKNLIFFAEPHQIEPDTSYLI